MMDGIVSFFGSANTWESLLIGAISSFIASRVFLSYTKAKIPDIKISDILIHNPEDSNICVKLVNLSEHSIIDVNITLYHIEFKSDTKSLSYLNNISEKRIKFINPKDDKDELKSYAAVARLPISKEISDAIKNNGMDDFMLEIIAKESFYSTTYTNTILLKPSQIKENRIFEIGDDVTTRVKNA